MFYVIYCGIEVKNHFLLESLATCRETNTKLIMYFMVNMSFIHYLDKFPNLTQSHELPIVINKTTFEQTLPISLNVSKFDSILLASSGNQKEFIDRYTSQKEIFDLQERH